ncbi:MAG: hypothetical protein GF317_01935 [Candidatus Lokiarchaeota archaeon]|nr:hypothetical protein [Candidatus Lokiarchaeota archaeon]MBD3198701.1 hypothetical protein [Candidatus Lokiarchaeota archaeon]
MVKKKKLKKIDIKKKRKRLIELRREKLDVDKKEKKEHLSEFDIRLNRETKLYWIRAITGAIFALFGRLIGFVGFLLFFWMLIFWFGFPFIASFGIFKYEYDKENWNWKNIIKPGLGIYFFLFMLVGTITHTFLTMLNYPLRLTLFGPI